MAITCIISTIGYNMGMGLIGEGIEIDMTGKISCPLAARCNKAQDGTCQVGTSAIIKRHYNSDNKQDETALVNLGEVSIRNERKLTEDYCKSLHPQENKTDKNLRCQVSLNGTDVVVNYISPSTNQPSSTKRFTIK